jgi:hypothetical protein
LKKGRVFEENENDILDKEGNKHERTDLFVPVPEGRWWNHRRPRRPRCRGNETAGGIFETKRAVDFPGKDIVHEIKKWLSIILEAVGANLRKYQRPMDKRGKLTTNIFEMV